MTGVQTCALPISPPPQPEPSARPADFPSADGRTLVYVSNRDGNFELYAIGRDGKGERRLTRTPRSDELNPRFSGDGARLLYAHEGRVATIGLDGTGARDLGAGVWADWR